jgi:hypothetical protein
LSDIRLYLEIDGTTYTNKTNTIGLISFSLNETPGTYQIDLTFESSILVSPVVVNDEITIGPGISQMTLQLITEKDIIPESVQIALNDDVNSMFNNVNYTVSIIRDGLPVEDTNWILGDGEFIIYPIYPGLNALSTMSNHQRYLYPGSYSIEMTRYHPYFMATTETITFDILPVTVTFEYSSEKINGTTYLEVLYTYPHDQPIDPEYTVTLINDQSREVLQLDTISSIPIPWNTRSITVSIIGYGYVSGYISNSLELNDTSDISSEIVSTNSTITGNPSSDGFSIDRNSFETGGLTLLIGTGIITQSRRWIKKRK